MAIRGRTIRVGASPQGWVTGFRLPASALKAPAVALGRLLLGREGGIRSYPPERFSDHELHQIVPDRKDHLDGLN